MNYSQIDIIVQSISLIRPHHGSSEVKMNFIVYRKYAPHSAVVHVMDHIPNNEYHYVSRLHDTTFMDIVQSLIRVVDDS